MNNKNMNAQKKRRQRLAKVYTSQIREDIQSLVERNNAFTLPERQVTIEAAVEVANRDLRKTRDQHPDTRMFSALRAVSAHIALVTNNKYTSASLQNSDLLPVGHPLSTREHAMTASALAHAQARWIAADKFVADESRSLVASAFSLEPGSVERRHAFARLSAMPRTSVPRMLALDPIIAAFGLGIGGDSSAARSARAKLQRRDRYGKFAFMGGGFSFNIRGLDGVFRVTSGRVVGATGTEGVELEIKGDDVLPDGIYTFPASKGESVKAIISPDALKKSTGRTPGVKDTGASDLFVDQATLERRDAPSGWEAADTAPGAPQMWKTTDGYFATKDGEDYSLHRADLATNDIGEKVASGNSWADIQEATVADQDDYAKVLEADAAKATAPEATKELAQGEAPEGWTTKVSMTMGSKVTGWNHVSPDGQYSVTETTTGPDGTASNLEVWRRNEGGSSGGKPKGDVQSSNLTSWDQVDAVIEADRPVRAAEPGQKAAEEEKFKKKVEEANKPSTAKPVELDYTKDIKLQLRQIAKDKGRVKFKYNGKERVVEPKDVFVNKYNGNLTLLTRGRDGKDISYLVDKIEAPYVPPVELTPEQKRANLISGIKRDITDSFVPDPSAKYADRIFPGPVGAKPRDTVKAEIAKADLTDAEKQGIIDWGVTRGGSSPADERLRPFYESFFEDAVSASEPAEVPEEAPSVQPNNSISKGDGVSISFPLADYEDDPESFADSVQRANDLGGFIEIDTTPTLDGADAIVVTFDKPRLTEEEANEFLGSEDEDGAFDARFSSDEDERDELFDALTSGQFEPTSEPAEVPEEAPEFISPEAGREVLDDGLSTVNAALGDIPDEDLDNLDEEDSEAITKVGDLLDSAQDAIDKIDPVGSDTNDLHFEQARADLGEAAQILSEANNGDMQNAGFDLKEAVDNFIALPQIDFGGGRAERAAREVPAAPEAPTGPEEPDMETILDEEFNATFETPEGAYKPRIFEYYTPEGRTDQDSADYTDDPAILANQFDRPELAIALREAVLPSDENDATGFGSLEFEAGQETVPAEALYEALRSQGVDADEVLAAIYDSQLDPNREQTNLERISMFKEDERILGGDAEIPTVTDRDKDVVKAVEKNRIIGKPSKSQRAVDLMSDFTETNPKIKDLADDLMKRQDEGLGYDSFNLSETLQQYIPWSTSADPKEREAFMGLWGVLVSLDGGSSNEKLTLESLSDPEAFRTIVYDALLELNGGDADVAEDAYYELVDTFGGMPEFVAGKEAIANGNDNLDSESVAASFYRLIAASSRPNEKSIYRSIGVRDDDELLKKYTTEGSLFPIDARSFTSTNITDGSLASQLFYPAGAGESRVIFAIAPGNTDSIDVSTISWFAGENEHFAYGDFEVVAVRQQPGLGGKKPEYVVEIRKATEGPKAEEPAAPGTSYSDIEGWTRVSRQLGSNPGGIFEDEGGNKYYVKVPKSPSHAQNESLASALYKEAGVPAVEVDLGFSDGELRTVSPIVPDSSTDLAFKLDDAEYISKLQEGFAIDAWLANWDVAGLTYDNVITDSNGNPVRVDPGGALMWRAQGAPKGSLFGNKVNEIDTLRDEDLNPTSSEVFGSMTDDDIRNSAAKLIGITPDRISEIVDSIITDPEEATTLKNRLIARRDDILKRFGPKEEDLLNEDQLLDIEEDANAPKPPTSPDDVVAMEEYKNALADYQAKNVVSKVWDCPGGLNAAGNDDPCSVPSADDLIDDISSKMDAVGTTDNAATADAILDDIMLFIENAQDEKLKDSTKKKAAKIAEELAEIREGIKDGTITNDQAIARLNAISDSIPVGGTSEDAFTLEAIAESIDDYRRILDGSFEDRPFSANLPPSGKGYAKDKTTFITPGKRVRNKWGYAGTVDRYDKNSWQVWVTMDIDPSGVFAPGYKKMSFSTKTLDVIQEGGDDTPWIDVPGTPEGKKPKTLDYTPTKFPPKGSPGEAYSKKMTEKIKKGSSPSPKAEAPKGATEAPEVIAAEIGDEVSVPEGEQGSTASRIPDDDILVKLMTEGGSSDENVDFNRRWAESLEQYTIGDGPADARIKSKVDFLASLGTAGIDLRDRDLFDRMLKEKIIYAMPPDKDHDKEWYYTDGIVNQLLHGISGFTSGRFFSTASKEDAKERIEVMEKENFFANQGGYVDSPTRFGSAPIEKSVAEFWTNFAKILNDPSIITDVKPENTNVIAGSAGMLLRALRVADPLEGDYTRVLHFMQDINDESHPLHYMLDEGREVTLRPTSWMKNDDIENIVLDDEKGLFQYGNFAKEDGALGDVLFTISNPRGLNAQPLPNAYGEKEVILSGGTYRVKKVEKKEIDGHPYTHITLEDQTVKPEKLEVPETTEVTAPEPSSVPEPVVKFDKGKVTGTGTKKVVVENPPPFEYSAFDEVPSMRGALDSLTNENVKYAKVRGASAAFDGGDIEDLEVRVEGIIDEQGNESTRISYKLTAWAGDSLTKSIEDGEGEWDSVSGVSIPRTTVDEKTGAILIKEPRADEPMSAYNSMGKTYVADAGNGIKVTLRRTPDTASALHNYVTIDMPYGTTDDEVARAMTIAGVNDPRPATTTDFRVLAENRLMSIFSGNTNAASNIKVAASREARLTDIKQKYGVTPDDVKIRVGTSGQIETVIPEEVGKKIAEMTGADTLEHDFALHSFSKLEAAKRGVDVADLTAEEKDSVIINGLIDFFVGPRGGGLVGTRARYFTGMQVQGMSSTSDLGTGGADYVFLRPSNGGSRHKNGVYGTHGAELAFDAAKTYTRLDWYANQSDKYGRRAKKTDVINNAKLGAYEVMFKKRLGLESLRSLALNQDFREKVLTEFEKRGIVEINGRPVDEVIVIAGRPGDPSGKFEKASKPFTEKLANLGAYGVGMSDLTPGLNTLIGTKFVYPPWDTKVYAISSDMKKVIAKNKSNQYLIYTSDGTESIVGESDIPTLMSSIGSPDSEFDLFFKNEIDYGKIALTNIISKYTSGDATPEATARALLALLKQAPSYSILIDIKNTISSKLDLTEAWKKIKEEL